MKKLLFLLISLRFLIPGYSFAATQNIYIEWTYDYQPVEGRVLAGYHLYKEGLEICTSNIPTDRTMNCTFDSEDGIFNFTLTAFFDDGYISPHSPTFTYTLTSSNVSEPELGAAFGTTPTSLSGDVPFPVSFDASASTGDIVSYSWDFGDNSTGSGSTSTHTYITEGTYNATLTVTNSIGTTSQKSVVVNVDATPIAAITTIPISLSGDTPFVVSFDGSGSTGNLSTYSWNFGDNSTGSGSMTSHTFTTAGTFNTILTVTSVNGTTSQKSVTINVSAAPSAVITTSPAVLTGDTPFTVSFDASASTGTIASYTWNFGDNSSGTGSQTSHTYTTAGSFNATLTVTSTNGTTSQKAVTVNVSAAPIAAIATSPAILTGNTPFAVSFDASASTGTIASYTWNFGDNSSGTGSQTSHTYTTAGSFNATLTVTSANGTISQKSVSIVTTTPPIAPVAIISPATFNGDVPLTILFDGSSSTGATSYAWVFGDGSVASGSQAEHLFTTAGIYTTILTVTNTQGLTNTTRVTVTVNEATTENSVPIAVISSSTTLGEAPLTISFDGSGSHDAEGPIASYRWNFGDGSQTTTGVTTAHNYTVAGTYNASLTVTDNQGATDTIATPVIITAQTIENLDPTARLATSVVEGTTPLEVVFDGSASTDPEESALTYSWNFGDGANGQGITASHIYTSPGTFTATLTVTDDMGATASTTTTITAEQETSMFQIELGEIEIDHNWIRIEFSEPFINPVVVAGPPSRTDRDPCVVRLKNITSTGFDIRIQEWDYLDGSHNKEIVAYLVMEQGNYTLDDGTMVEAGQFDSNDNEFNTVQFNTTFTTEPVVMTSIRTFNEEEAVTDRLRNISTTSFEHKTQEQESSSRKHGNETVNYIAWEPSQNKIGDINVVVDKTADKVRDRWFTIEYNEQLPELPIFLGTMQSQDGFDTSTIRYANRTDSEIQVTIEEEQSEDDETRHTSETVGYFLFYVSENVPSDGNISPVAVISANTFSGTAPLTVNFDASKSSDADGSVVSYLWDFGDGTPPATTINVMHTFSTIGSFQVSLVVSDEKGTNSTITQTTITTNYEANTTAYAINFQPTNALIPDGYKPDSGQLFDEETGYGWILAPFSFNMRDRNSPLSPDQAYDTLLYFYPAATWEIILPEGNYSITICMGDPVSSSGYQNVQVENETLVEGVYLTTKNRWTERTKNIFINDGRLTLTFDGSDPARLSWLKLEKL